MSDKPTAAAAGTISIGGDLTVNRMGFGAMRITGDGIWGPPKDPEQAKDALRKAVELGVNFIDTADSYGPDVSEALIAEALYPYPDDLVIGTKGGLLRPGPGRWDADGRPEHLREACEGSLRRLKLDQIPLYQFHRPDPKVPYAESIGALIELRAEGKIRHIGVSNVSEAQLHEAQKLDGRPVRAGGHRVPAVGADPGLGPAGARPDCSRAARREHAPGRARLAAEQVGADTADSGFRISGARGAERCRRVAAADE
jgi:hypothetical protein